MIIPVRYIGTGDLSKAKLLEGVGKQCAAKYKEFLGFRKLPTGKSGTYFSHWGSTIKVEATYGCFEVHIHVPLDGEGVQTKEYECLCLPHFSLARIEAVDQATPTAYFLREGRFKYDVSICLGNTYLFLEDVYDANFGKYLVGQYVMVTIGAEMAGWDNPLDCERYCLMQQPRFSTLMISPIHVLSEMRESREVIK